MFITRLKATGLTDLVDHDEMSRTAPLFPTAAVAAADALSLFQAALLGPSAFAALGPTHLGAVRADDDPEAPPRYDLWNVDAVGVGGLLDADADEVTVEVTITPDPPLYGRLREHALRDPRLLSALGQQAEMHVKVGWRFTHGRTFATSDLLGARIGDVGFPMSGKERPAWLNGFLLSVAQKIVRLDLTSPWQNTVDRCLQAATSPYPNQRLAWKRMAATATPQVLYAFRDGDRAGLALGDTLRQARHIGRQARDAIRVAAAVLLDQPDVLVVPEVLPSDVRDWMDNFTQGEAATIEQAIRP